jgi:hypothetical protein
MHKRAPRQSTCVYDANRVARPPQINYTLHVTTRDQAGPYYSHTISSWPDITIEVITNTSVIITLAFK